MKPVTAIPRLKIRVRRCVLVVASVVAILVTSSEARAGLGPENVVVVVNSDSLESRTIANHYVALRNIPSINVVFLKDVPSGLSISLDQFKSRILVPLLEQVNARKLAPQAKVIAYSAGFPTSVKISEHTSRLTDPDQKKYQLPTASLTGLTYFYQFMLADNEKYLDWGANLYARGLFERHFVNPYFDSVMRQRFDEAIAHRDAGRFQAAAEAFERLFEESRTIAPLAILAAESRAQEGDGESATRLIGQAIGAGWNSGTYLDESEALAPLLESPPLRVLRSKLENHATTRQEPIGFTATAGWTSSGWPSASLQDGVPYLMSCMLAVVHPRGSTLEQATQVLKTAAGCDSTFPAGGFWFTYTRDDRTNPRFPEVGNALLWLKQAGYDAEIIHASMPNAKKGPCVGLMLGVADIPLENRTWQFVPGAISENLTSLSAHFETGAQTKITELLHAGAAMSCGPVFEPYNLPFKFPNPMMYAYYASGATAIEAFYLSVTSPYQLLIVGDPLAQPFARSPTDWVGMQVTPLESGKRSIQFSRRPLPLGERSNEAALIEIYLEGKLVRVTPAVSRVEMSVPEQVAGTLDVRSVLVGGGSLQPRVSHAEWLTLGEATGLPEAQWLAEKNSVQLVCSGASSIELMHHGESIGSIQGAEGQIELDRSSLGTGPIRLRPIATFAARRVPGQAIVVGNQ